MTESERDGSGAGGGRAGAGGGAELKSSLKPRGGEAEGGSPARGKGSVLFHDKVEVYGKHPSRGEGASREAARHAGDSSASLSAEEQQRLERTVSRFSELERRVVEALRAWCGAPGAGGLMLSGRPSPRSWNAVMLKFPMIKAAFGNLRGLFSVVDSNGNGTIDFGEWDRALSVGMAMEQVPEQLKRDLWKEVQVSGMGDGKSMNFRQFVIVVCILYITGFFDEAVNRAASDPDLVGLGERDDALGHGSGSIRASTLKLGGSPLTVLRSVQEAMDVVIQSFHMFDTSRLGFLYQQEIRDGLTSERGEGRGGAFFRDRLSEMELDGDGVITFVEYLYAFEDWVGLEDSEDED